MKNTVKDPEKYVNLWIAINMYRVKPRSIIPIIKDAYIAGYKLAKSETKKK